MLCKGDMVASLLASFGTRSALMVGDRSSDRDAAWENGIPHVHCSFGYAQGDESVEAEGRIRSLDELPELLARRAAWVNAALERVGAFSRPGLRIGITGGPAAGKTTFARDAARVLRARGLRASALSMQPFVAPSAADPADPLEQACDTERLLAEVLKPHEHGREILLEAPDLLGQRRIERGATVFLAGPALLGAKLRLGLDRLILIDVDEPVQKRRLSGRARARGAGEPDSVPPADCQLELERRYPPEQNADLVLDGSNPLGEELGRVEACARNAAFATLRDPAGSS